MRCQIKKNRDMENNTKKKGSQYERYSDLTAKLLTMRGRADARTMCGKMLLISQESELIFQENAPRGPRSREVFRTLHTRCVRRPDGDYTLTFRFKAGMPYMRATLIAELRESLEKVELNYKAETITDPSHAEKKDNTTED